MLNSAIKIIFDNLIESSNNIDSDLKFLFDYLFNKQITLDLINKNEMRKFYEKIFQNTLTLEKIEKKLSEDVIIIILIFKN